MGTGTWANGSESPGDPRFDGAAAYELACEEREGTRRIYLNADCTVWAVVDAIDYAWAIQWKWGITFDRHKRKMYATRSTRRRKETTKQIKVYLHKEILLRSGKVQPTEEHHIGDHEDGDSLNDRRSNLEWATPAQNAATARRTR